MQVSVDPKSNRLQLLEPFSNWSGSDITGAQVRLRHVAAAPSSVAPTLNTSCTHPMATRFAAPHLAVPPSAFISQETNR